MQQAVEEAKSGIEQGHGGPFGAVIVRDNEIIGRGHNMVIANNDPTAHGEITAIRDAGQNIGNHSLEGSIIYTTGYPCMMCYAAIDWANIEKIFYGCTTSDAEEIGFRDKQLEGHTKNLGSLIEAIQVGRDNCFEVFLKYKRMADKELY